MKSWNIQTFGLSDSQGILSDSGVLVQNLKYLTDISNRASNSTRVK